MRTLQLANCADLLNSSGTAFIMRKADFSVQVLVSSALTNSSRGWHHGALRMGSVSLVSLEYASNFSPL